MMKLLVLAGALAMAMVLPGCGTDERERLITQALDQLDSAANNLSTIKDNVVKWEKEKKETDKPKLLKNAVEATVALSKNAKDLQYIKGMADKLETGTPETRKEYVDKYRDRFASAIENVNKERIALTEAIARAERKEKAPLAELKVSLQRAQGDFENLVKQR